MLTLALLLKGISSKNETESAVKNWSTELKSNASFSIIEKLRQLRRGGGGGRGGGGFRGGRSGGRGGRSGGGVRTSRGSFTSRSAKSYYSYRSRIYYYNTASSSYIVASQATSQPARI